MNNKMEKILLTCIYLTIFFSLGIMVFMFSNKENNKDITNSIYNNEDISNSYNKEIK